MELIKFEEIRGIIPESIDSEEQFSNLLKETTKRENHFLLHKKGREIWHGMAYAALTIKKQKAKYRKEFSLSKSQVCVWSKRTVTSGNRTLLDRYDGTHIDAVNEFVPEDHQEEWLEKAKVRKWAAKYLKTMANEEFDPKPEETPEEELQRTALELEVLLKKVAVKAKILEDRIEEDFKQQDIYMGMGVAQAFYRTVMDLVDIARRLSPREEEKILEIEEKT